MQRIRLVALASVIATLVVFALGAGNIVHAVNNAIQNVFVTNTAANPVPVTGVVTVSNSVGTVSVNNLPAIQPVSGTVNVGNFPARGEPVRLMAVFSETTVSGEIVPFINEPEPSTYTVPAGKQLIIEFASARHVVPEGRTVETHLYIDFQPFNPIVSLPCSKQLASSHIDDDTFQGAAQDTYACAQSMRWVVNAGEQVYMIFERSGSTAARHIAQAVIGGTLVDAP
jgi:hypothetical protein